MRKSRECGERMRVQAVVLLAAGLALFCGAERAGAMTVVAGISFDDNAFADAVSEVTGSPSFMRIVGPTAFDRVATTAEDAVLGADLGSMTIEMTASQSFVLAFVDNMIVNGVGPDLAIFEEYSAPEGGSIQVEIGGVVQTFTTSSLGSFDVIPNVSNAVNIGYSELSDFGLAAGETTQYVKVWGSASEFAVFGALNNSPVPEPMTLALVGVALTALGLFARKSS